jgi:salicylate 5-hydroxylase small subunit
MNAELYFKLTQFYQDYAAAVDTESWDAWMEMFTENCIYRIQSRENFERNLPMAALSLEGQGMLKDRIYGITETIFHDPYMQNHVVSAPRIKSVTDDLIHSEANYAVFRTKMDGIAQVYNVGRYIDQIEVSASGLKLKSRICLFDNDMILNSMIYPI